MRLVWEGGSFCVQPGCELEPSGSEALAGSRGWGPEIWGHLQQALWAQQYYLVIILFLFTILPSSPFPTLLKVRITFCSSWSL